MDGSAIVDSSSLNAWKQNQTSFKFTHSIARFSSAADKPCTVYVVQQYQCHCSVVNWFTVVENKIDEEKVNPSKVDKV